MDEDKFIDEDQYLEKELEKILRYLKFHRPERANKEGVLRMHAAMQKLARKWVGEDIDFAELLVKTLEEESEEDRNEDQANNDE